MGFWGEAFQGKTLLFSKNRLGNAVAPTPYFGRRSWPKNIKSKKHTLESRLPRGCFLDLAFNARYYRLRA